jgi:uncharacterized protein
MKKLLMVSGVLLMLAAILLVSNIYTLYYFTGRENLTSKVPLQMSGNSVPQIQATQNANAPGISAAKDAFAVTGGGMSIPIVAVSNNGSGVMSSLTLRLIPGSGQVLVNTNPFVEPDLQFSVNSAVDEARNITGYNSNEDFIFTYYSPDAQLIGGGSAGAATAILSLATFENKPLKKDAVITGTINEDGTIGEIGGVVEKAQAVGEAGYKYFLVPAGQSTVTEYEPKVTKFSRYGYTFYRETYTTKTIDLKAYAKEHWNLDVVEVSSLQDAIPYFIQQ